MENQGENVDPIESVITYILNMSDSQMTIGNVSMFDTQSFFFLNCQSLHEYFRPIDTDGDWTVPLVRLVSIMTRIQRRTNTPDSFKILFLSVLCIKLITFITLLTGKSKKIFVYQTLLNEVFVPVRDATHGWLHIKLKKMDFDINPCNPAQAPRGWSCAVCLKSSDSHLTVKTLCNHYFHIGCHLEIPNPCCPLCRSHMFRL
jgi:hypothetical protein